MKKKSEAEQKLVADRIKAMDLDVLAVQEVEDVDTLKVFNATQLGGLYDEVGLVEGNDPRLIDVGVLSKLPLGGVTSWRHGVFLPDPVRPIFSRDMLEVEIMNEDRNERLLTLFIHHLKSRFVPFGTDKAQGAADADELRRRQCVAAASIIEARTRPDTRFVVLGNMNDDPDSPSLQPLVASPTLHLANALAAPVESRDSPVEDPMPGSTAWTERFKEAGSAAQHNLFDQIWLSPSLAPLMQHAEIERRTHLGGDGSDHDPAWVQVDL